MSTESALEAYREMAQRRRTIHLTADQVARMLTLPDDCVVLHVIGRTDPSGIDVIVANPSFSPVPDEAQAPYLQRSVVVHGDGQVDVTFIETETGYRYRGPTEPAWMRP